MAYIVFDMETTGLDPQEDEILEVALQIRSQLTEFDPRGEVGVFPVKHSVDDVLTYKRTCDQVVLDMHSESGLWDTLIDVKRRKFRLKDVDQVVAASLSHREGPHYLVGNSIRLDRAFIEAQMPGFAGMLHYRQIDLTAFRLMAEAVGIPAPVLKQQPTHRAADDVRSSIELLNHQLGVLRDVVWAQEYRGE